MATEPGPLAFWQEPCSKLLAGTKIDFEYGQFNISFWYFKYSNTRGLSRD